MWRASALSTSLIPVYAPCAEHGCVMLGSLDSHVSDDMRLRASRSATAAATPCSLLSGTRVCCSVHWLPPYVYFAVRVLKPRGGGCGLLARKPQLPCHSAAALVSSSRR